MTSAEMFSLFYSEYPRHKARKDALKAWMRLEMTESGFDEIMTAVRLQKATCWLDKDPQFIPYPASWIRGERWEDEIEYAKPEPARETHTERITRKNRETAERVNRSLFAPDGNSVESRDSGRTNRNLLPGSGGSE